LSVKTEYRMKNTYTPWKTPTSLPTVTQYHLSSLCGVPESTAAAAEVMLRVAAAGVATVATGVAAGAGMAAGVVVGARAMVTAASTAVWSALLEAVPAAIVKESATDV
jgi:hypothetical protein